MKLSPAQLQILQGLAGGFELSRAQYTRGGLQPPRFKDGARQEFKAAPLDGLLRRGLVTALSRKLGVFRVVYVITDAGRDAWRSKRRPSRGVRVRWEREGLWLGESLDSRMDCWLASRISWTTSLT